MSPPEYITGGGFSSDESSQLCFYKGLWHIEVSMLHADIEDTDFSAEYLHLISLKTWENPETTRVVDDFVYAQCRHVLDQAPSTTSTVGVTLDRLCAAPRYDLRIVRDGITRNIRVEGADNVSYMPTFDIAPLPIADLPKSCHSVPHIQASTVTIAEDPTRAPTTPQGEVLMADGTRKYFKHRWSYRQPDFAREVDCMARIEGAKIRGGETRIPALVGIVVDKDQAIGFLMDLIPTSPQGLHLLSEGFWERPELHRKWEKQVTDMVEVLHEHGIVWGDVNPCNVVIDEELNAWIIDFGGMNNVEFIDDAKRETVEGDWQGVKYLFRKWLPSRRVGGSAWGDGEA